jgi:hypothetical protein
MKARRQIHIRYTFIMYSSVSAKVERSTHTELIFNFALLVNDKVEKTNTKGEKAYSRTPGVQGVQMGVREYSGSTGVQREYGSTMGVRKIKWEYIKSTTDYFIYL